MATDSGVNRWWENYLVRYLMPSIAGVVIVRWLCWYPGINLGAQLLLPSSVEQLNTPSLVLLFLYGNLFCYIASFPILVFHVTRATDFDKYQWKPRILDGYILTCLLALAVSLCWYLVPRTWWVRMAFTLAALFSCLQLCRIRKGLSMRVVVEQLPNQDRAVGLRWEVSFLFGFAYALAHSRSVPEKVHELKLPGCENVKPEDMPLSAEPNIRRTVQWRPELVATYRHLREHGNSAFIFFLELILAALVFFTISQDNLRPEEKLEWVGALFTFWVLPAVFVHLVGQHMERRFSMFDERIVNEANKPK
jgi:hypothetical protein